MGEVVQCMGEMTTSGQVNEIVRKIVNGMVEIISSDKVSEGGRKVINWLVREGGRLSTGWLNKLPVKKCVKLGGRSTSWLK